MRGREERGTGKETRLPRDSNVDMCVYSSVCLAQSRLWPGADLTARRRVIFKRHHLWARDSGIDTHIPSLQHAPSVARCKKQFFSLIFFFFVVFPRLMLSPGLALYLWGISPVSVSSPHNRSLLYSSLYSLLRSFV